MICIILVVWTEVFAAVWQIAACERVIAGRIDTMDVISRLKSAVTNVLPVGNPITGEFEILGQRASGGPALLWKVYDGVQRSTKQACFVFNFSFYFLMMHPGLIFLFHTFLI